MTENKIASIVFRLALNIHKKLGPGLLENVYEECLFHDLRELGLKVEKQKPLPLIYNEVQLEIGYRLDLLIENKFIVEVKSVEALNDIHLAQILTYLKLSNCRLGMLINFNVAYFKTGVRRVINGQL